MHVDKNITTFSLDQTIIFKPLIFALYIMCIGATGRYLNRGVDKNLKSYEAHE